MHHARHRARTTTLLVFLVAVLVLLMGVFAGVCFYRQYLRAKVHRLNCYIPYSDDVDREENYWVNTQWRDGPTFADSLKMVKTDDDDNEISESVCTNTFPTISILTLFLLAMRLKACVTF